MRKSDNIQNLVSFLPNSLKRQMKVKFLDNKNRAGIVKTLHKNELFRPLKNLGKFASK